MENNKVREILDRVAVEDTSFQEKAAWREANRAWLDRSAKIAIAILSTLRSNRKESKAPATQKELAENLGISPQQINKIVRGQENLTLETISRLEQALSIRLVEFAHSYVTKTSYSMVKTEFTSWQKIEFSISKEMNSTAETVVYPPEAESGESNYAMAA
ncbi:transcriptional regulator [Persicitalea sp.]|uniref:helix-turn-helix transcriptional regulator n=1 Tax=Persicitalea sp. TaxID=3100273 RepID=UPI003593CC81